MGAVSALLGLGIVVSWVASPEVGGSTRHRVWLCRAFLGLPASHVLTHVGALTAGIWFDVLVLVAPLHHGAFATHAACSLLVSVAVSPVSAASFL